MFNVVKVINYSFRFCLLVLSTGCLKNIDPVRTPSHFHNYFSKSLKQTYSVRKMLGNLFKTNPGIQSSLQNMLQVCPLTYSNPLTEVGNNVFFHACWNGSDFIFKILLELGNLSRLVGRHFALQVAPQVEVWGLRSGEWGLQKVSRRLLLTWIVKCSFIHAREAIEQ